MEIDDAAKTHYCLPSYREGTPSSPHQEVREAERGYMLQQLHKNVAYQRCGIAESHF